MAGTASREMAVVLRQYDVYAKRIAFFERGYVVYAGNETGWLQPWRRRADVQRYLAVYRALDEKDSPLLLPLIRTKKRQEVVFTSRRAYTFSRWPEDALPAKVPRAAEDFRRWGEGIGKLHRQLAEDAPAPGSFPFAGWIETMRRRRQRVLEVQRWWLAAAELPPEERLYLRNIPPMLERIDTSVWMLEDLKERWTEQPVPAFGPWTLGDLADSFLALPTGELKLAPWKPCLPGCGLGDLGRLLLLAWETGEPQAAMEAAVEGFEREWPMTADMFQALLAFMMFPHTLWSLLRRALADQPGRGGPATAGSAPDAADVPRLPVELEFLKTVYRQERAHRPLLAWLNRQIAERRAPGSVVRAAVVYE